MQIESPDWLRLQKALSVEAERGFTDLMGKQYRFSEFLSLEFGKTPSFLPLIERHRWQEMASQFARYPNLTLSQRQHLVLETRRFLQQMQQVMERQARSRSHQRNEDNQQEVETIKSPPSPDTQAPRTTPLVQSNSGISLDQPLTSLPDVGVRKGGYLAKLDLHTVRDILFYYPRDHIDYARQVNISELESGETVTLIGTVKRCTCFSSPKNKKLTIMQVVLKDRTGQISLSRFFAGSRYSNRGWQEGIKNRYPQGAVVAASGLVKKSQYGLTLDDPQLEVLANPGDPIDSHTIGRVVPVYPLTEGVAADMVRQAVVAALPAAAQLKDPLPTVLRDGYGLMKLSDAIANIHFPADSAAKEAARRRLVFDEFFYLQLGFLMRRQAQRQKQSSAILAPRGKLIEQFHQVLPFRLTGAQQRVLNDILNDLQSSTPMNRLVQGDVGSGKTVVAVIAILAAIQSGYQAALMAPTEVLAEQHYRKLVSWFNLLYLPVELLTGSTKTAKRRQIHAHLET
ncbi:MAG: DEAD/DEAH box helicase, partial [Cyanobacteriota bacterium]